MNKTLLAVALVALTSAASARDLTLHSVRQFGPDVNAAGVTLGTERSGFRYEAGIARSGASDKAFNAYSLAAGVPVVKSGNFTVLTKGTVSYIDADGLGGDGFAFKPSLEAAYALNKQVSLVGEVGHVFPTNDARRVAGGNVVGLGLRLAF